MWSFWLIVTGIFLVLEMATTGFLLFWLGVGALFAMVVSLITESIAIQTAVFVISSAILIPLTKPLVNKYINPKDNTPTNANSLINKKGLVTIAINSIESSGQVKVNGEIWSAKCEETDIIPVGTEVEVLKIEGVKLLVSPVKKSSTV